MNFQRFRPRAKHNIPGKMNKLEKSYQDILEHRKLAGEIVRYRYEALKFKLAPNTFFTPDFMVTFEDRVEIHETKGFWEEDARIKIKMAAELFPEFVFMGVQYKKKIWMFEEF
jgi:hypothetical protein